MSEILIANSSTPRRSIKEYILKHKIIPYKCECGNLGEWRGKKLRLHLDHINGLRYDNRKENLRFLCPNCHDQQPTSHIKKGVNYNKAVKLTVEAILEARKNSANIRQLLILLNAAESSVNYLKVKKILDRLNQSFETSIKIVGLQEKTKSFARPLSRKVLRPSKDELIKLISQYPMTKIAEQFGLRSDNSIRKWCKSYDIDFKNLSPFSWACSPVRLRNE